MLVLSRRTDEKIFLRLEDGRVIEIATVEIRENKVRLGVVAPRTIGVFRQEIWSQLPEEEKASVIPPVQNSAA